MPTDDILIRFIGDTGQLKAEFDELQAGLKKTTEEQKKAGAQAKVSSKEIEEAAKRRNALLAAEINVLKQLEQQQKKAFTPAQIKEFNDRISQSQKNISLLKGEGDKLAGSNSVLGSSFVKLGGLIAAAFSVSQIIAFSDAAVTKFAEAQKAATQLTLVFNGNEGAQRRLIKLADELQDSFAIDNDVIIGQINFLGLQGRTESQIKKTITAAIQLGAVMGGTLEENVQKLDGTFEGVTGRLGKLDSRISGLSKTQLANGAAIDIINEKYKGFAEKGLEGVTGQLQKIQVETENVEEELGKQIAPIKLASAKFASAWIEGIQLIVDSTKSFFKPDTSILNPFNWFKPDFWKGQGSLQPPKVEPLIDTQLKILSKFNDDALKGIKARTQKELDESKNLSNQQIEIRKTQIEAIDKILADRHPPVEIDPAELKAIRERAIKEQEARKQSTEALRKFTLQSLQDKITDEDTAAKELAAKQITNSQELASRLEQIDIETLEKRKALLIEFGESTSEIQKSISEKTIALNQKNAKEDLQATLNAIDVTTQQTIEALENRFQLQADKSKEAIDKKNHQINVLEIQGEIAKDEEILKSSTLTDSERLAAQKKLAQDLAKLYEEDGQAFEDNEKRKQDAIIKTLDEIGQAAQAFTDILNAQTESQIQSLTDAQQAQTDSFDKQKEHLQALFDAHRISQEEFDKRSKALAKSREKAEKDSQDRIKALKLEEAKREKALAIFTIALDIAKHLAAIPTDFIGAAIAAAELIAVSIKPLPSFAKGTKGKQGSGLALVGEQGAELTYLPSQAKVLPAQRTKQYSEVIDSMFDGRLDEYIHKNYVLPAMKLQSPSVNINIDYKKLAKANKQRDSISIDNLHELAEMFDHNPRRVI